MDVIALFSLFLLLFAAVHSVPLAPTTQGITTAQTDRHRQDVPLNIQQRGTSLSDVSRSSICLVNRSSLIDRGVCFIPCQAHCPTQLALGELHLGCLTGACSRSEVTSIALNSTPYLNIDSQLPVGIDTVNDLVYRSTEGFFQLGRRVQYGLALTPNSTVAVNIAKLREDGFRVDTLTAELAAVVLPSPDCSELIERKVAADIIFTVHLNSQLFREVTGVKRTLDLAIPLAEDVEVVELTTSVLSAVWDYDAMRCLRGVWGRVHLSRHPRTFPACRPKCKEVVQRGHALLSCFVEGCTAQRIRLDANSGHVQPYLDVTLSTEGTAVGIDSLPAKGHPTINFWEIPGKGVSSDHFDTGVAVRGSRQLTFDISKIRYQLASIGAGSDFDVFVAKAGLVPLEHASCRASFKRQHRDSHRTNLPLATFSVLVDGFIRTRSTVVRSGNNSMSAEILAVPIPRQAERLTLKVAYLSAAARKCTRAAWAGAELRRAKTLRWRTCQERCEKNVAAGLMYLSCLLGVCSGQTTFKSNPPFFWLRQAAWGVGMDTSGGWASTGKHPMWFSEVRQPFKRGIGAQAPSTLLFDLDALRLANLTFTTFSVHPGIDRNSGCWRGLSSGEFRVYIDGSLALTRRFAHARQNTGGEVHLPIQSAHRLELVTRSVFHSKASSCTHTAWGNARLWSFLPVLRG